MIKENTNFIMGSHHYFKQNTYRLPGKDCSKITTLQPYTVQIIGFTMRDILLKKRKKKCNKRYRAFFLNGKTIIFE